LALHSMTGFASAELKKKDALARVEIRSVNHRFLDVAFRMPSVFSAIEAELLAVIRSLAFRGRLEVSISLSVTSGEDAVASFDSANFASLWSAAEEAMQVSNSISEEARAAALGAILSRRELFDAAPGQSLDRAQVELVKTCLADAVSKLNEMRKKEGAALRDDLQMHLKTLQEVVKGIQQESSQLPEQFNERLATRVGRLHNGGEVDKERLAQEIALLADKVDISEEVVRLGSHFEQFTTYLDARPIGRKMEFLLQELGREFNTCAAKAQSSSISQLVVEAKAVLEKMREQAQNVE